MAEIAAHTATVFMGFFAIMNPIANTPVFLGVTSDLTADERRMVAGRSVALATVIIITFCAIGRVIFDLFGITLPAFRIAGGLLVFRVGFQMLQGENSRESHPTGADASGDDDSALALAISPLALPILAGPGTIATAMSFAADGGLGELAITSVAFLALCAITYASFRSGERLVALVGRNGIQVITRLMGLILAVIGTQMALAGISGWLATLPA